MALNRIETDGIEDDAITTDKILDGTVGPADIGDGELTNTQINASAAIAVSKISGLGTAATLDFGTGANQILQLDGTGKLPALNASALTNLDANDLSGNLPAINASNLTNLTAGNLTGAVPAISGANLTGVATDTSALENNIAILAFKTQSANNLAKFNLVDQVIDEYKDATGFTSAGSLVAQAGGTTAALGYLATIIEGSETELTLTTGMFSHTTWVVNWSLIINGSTSAYAIYSCASNTWGSTPGTLTIDYGSAIRWKYLRWFNFQTSSRVNEHKVQTSTDGSTWVDATTTVSEGTTSSSSILHNVTDANVWNRNTLDTPVTARWIRYVYSSNHQGNDNCAGIAEIEAFTSSLVANAAGTAISTANTALTSPTTGDIVMLMEHVGTAPTLGTDLKVFVSRNGGAAWDEATGDYALTDVGTWGTNKTILTANNIPFTGAAGTDMRYKIEWANQVQTTKETRVHATSLAWA